MLGIFRNAPNGGGRLEPVDKKMLGKELAIPAGATADAQDGDLVAVETGRAPRLGRPTARVVERLGSLAQRTRGQLDRDPRPFNSQCVPPRHAGRSGSRKACNAVRPGRLARASADHHRPARRQGSRRRRACRTRYRGQQSWRLHRHRRHRRRRPLRDAGLGARPRSFGARQLGLLPRPRGADAARAHLQRSVLAAAARRSRRARGAHGDRRRRPQALAHVPPHHDALGREAFVPADAGRHRRAHRRHHRTSARAGAEAALRRLRSAQTRARRAPAARSRSAGA